MEKLIFTLNSSSTPDGRRLTTRGKSDAELKKHVVKEAAQTRGPKEKIAVLYQKNLPHAETTARILTKSCYERIDLIPVAGYLLSTNGTIDKERMMEMLDAVSTAYHTVVVIGTIMVCYQTPKHYARVHFEQDVVLSPLQEGEVLVMDIKTREMAIEKATAQVEENELVE